MSNYIKIPISANPGRAMVTTVGALTASITTNSTDATTLSSPTAKTFTTSGGGTSAVVALTVAAGAVTVATATTAGDGYKAGDTLTFDKSIIGGTTDVVITLVAGDLTAVDADAGSEQLIPIDDIISVESVLSSGSLVDNKLFISTKVASGDTTNTHSEFAGWTVSFSDLKYDEANCIASISEAIAKAAAAVNSQPVVAWFAGAEVEAIAYGKNPTTLS